VLETCIVIFTAARYAHTAVYLGGVQPWRSLSHAIGVLSTIVVIVLLIASAVR
jgi:uncharacterized MAPEG superfamily protein